MLQKYFIAIVPPEPILSNIEDIKQDIFKSFNVKGALLSPAHITLHMPFSWDDEKENKLLDGLKNFKFKNKVQILLKDYSSFEPRVVFIDVIKNEFLEQLQKELVKYVRINLQLFNQADDMRGFEPHVTVAFRDLKKQQFYKLWEIYKEKKYSAEFICNSLFLMKHSNKRWEIYKEFNFNDES